MNPTSRLLLIWAVLACITISSAEADGAAGSNAPAQVSGRTHPRSSGVSRSVAVARPSPGTEHSGNILIPSPGADPNAMDELASDLLVMCRIFDRRVMRKETTEEGVYDMMYPGPTMAPMPFLSPRGVLDRFLNEWDSETKALYVQGYGAVFTVNVRFPLKPAVEQPSETPEPDPGDPLWAETRQEIFEPHRAKRESQGPVYKPQLVDQLKRQVHDTLRYAANIRGMDPGEYITVVIHGPDRSASQSDPEIAALTLRVRKGHVDARAAGSLNSTGFQGKVEVTEF